MRTFAGAAALLAALATGGVPVVVTTVAQADRAADEATGAPAVSTEVTADEAADGTADGVADADQSTPGDRRERSARTTGSSEDHKPAKPADKPADKLADGKPGYGPPAHARSNARGKGAGQDPGHGQATRAWAACVSEHAARHGHAAFDPETACGTRPTPPGQQRQKAAPAKP